MSNMVVQTNVAALNSHRNLKTIGTTQSKASQRLSSGYKINSAADDAAGLAISEKMRAQIRGLDMASKNSQDAISLIQTAEGGMQEIDNMLQRVRELVNQASNDTNEHNAAGTGDRQKMQDEVDRLVAEIDSMAERVEFNKKKIINGSYSGVDTTSTTTSAGRDAAYGAYTAASAAFVSASDACISASNNSTLAESAYGAFTGADIYASYSDPISAAGGVVNNASTAYDAAKGAVTATAALAQLMKDLGLDTSAPATAGTAAINATYYTATASAGGMYTGVITDSQQLGTLTAVGSLVSVVSTYGSAAVSVHNGTQTVINLAESMGQNIGSDGAYSAAQNILSNSDDASKIAAAQAYVDNYDKLSGLKDAYDNQVDIHTNVNNAEKDLKNALNDAANDAAAKGLDYAAKDADYQVKKAAYDAEELKTVTTPVEGNSLYFQLGANANQGIEVTINAIKSDKLGIGDGNGLATIDVLKDTGADITSLLDTLDTALSYVTSERSKLGATQNRLEYTIKSLEISSENLSAAESRIRDTDMAKEMMAFTKSNVLQQAATSMLSQANQLPQNVLQLLR